jgi:hypothetical protein
VSLSSFVLVIVKHTLFVFLPFFFSLQSAKSSFLHSLSMSACERCDPLVYPLLPRHRSSLETDDPSSSFLFPNTTPP